MEDYGVGCLFESGLIPLFDKIVRGGDIAYNRGYNQMYDLPLLEIPFPGDVLKVGVPAAKFGEYLLLSHQQQPAGNDLMDGQRTCELSSSSPVLPAHKSWGSIRQLRGPDNSFRANGTFPSTGLQHGGTKEVSPCEPYHQSQLAPISRTIGHARPDVSI